MKNRKFVFKRYADAGIDMPAQFTFEDGLTKSEFERRAAYKTLWPQDTGDLNQNPDKRPIHSSNGNLNTLIKSTAVLWHHESNRPFVPSELATSMGFPIKQEHQLIARAKHSLSR
eukprot:5577909-Pyramimonas_sp.AAC.1